MMINVQKITSAKRVLMIINGSLMMINVQKITSAKRVLMIINGSLMMINVQKITSAKRDVNISLLEKCYWIFHFSLFVFPFQGASLSYLFTFLPFYL